MLERPNQQRHGMTYHHDSPENQRKAKRLLRDLLPRAKALARGSTGATRFDLSPLGASISGLVHARNLLAVHIYEANLGGWIADLEVKKAPVGAPRIYGTPVENPCRTREEALDQAINMLAAVLLTDQPEPKLPSHRIFELYGLGIPVPGAALDELHSAVGETKAQAHVSGEEVEVLIEATVARLFAGMPTKEKLLSLAREELAELFLILGIAMLKGYFRYPAPQARPSGHDVRRSKNGRTVHCRGIA
jgi:hypothetical protein